MADWLDNVRRKFDRFRELEQILADPKAFEDVSAYGRYAKERSNLAPIAETFSNFTRIEEEIRKTEAEELVRLAEEPIHQLQILLRCYIPEKIDL